MNTAFGQDDRMGQDKTLQFLVFHFNILSILFILSFIFRVANGEDSLDRAFGQDGRMGTG